MRLPSRLMRGSRNLALVYLPDGVVSDALARLGTVACWNSTLDCSPSESWTRPEQMPWLWALWE